MKHWKAHMERLNADLKKLEKERAELEKYCKQPGLILREIMKDHERKERLKNSPLWKVMNG